MRTDPIASLFLKLKMTHHAMHLLLASVQSLLTSMSPILILSLLCRRDIQYGIAASQPFMMLAAFLFENIHTPFSYILFHLLVFILILPDLLIHVATLPW